MSSELTNDDLDEFEVELAQVEQTLRLLADDHVDPSQVLEWMDHSAEDNGVDTHGVDTHHVDDDIVATAPAHTGTDDDDRPLAPVVDLPTRFSH